MSYQALDIAVLAGRAFLATILIIAGAAKLVDRDGFTLTLIGLGVSARAGRLARDAALLVPAVELGLGFWVVSRLAPAQANVAVLAMMAAFSGIIGFAALRAPSTTCRCFGALSDSRFGRNLLLRGIGLTLLALLVVRFSPAAERAGTASWWMVAVLMAEYLALAMIAARAVRVVQELKERMAAA